MNYRISTLVLIHSQPDDTLETAPDEFPIENYRQHCVRYHYIPTSYDIPRGAAATHIAIALLNQQIQLLQNQLTTITPIDLSPLDPRLP